MRKFIFSISSLLIGGIVLISTNIVSAQVSYGVKLGPDFSSLTYKINNSKTATKMIVGLLGGVYANLPIAPQLYIQPSLMYEGKGGTDYNTDNEIRLSYLTLPIDFLFKPEMPNGSGSWIIGFGPYLGYGILGKVSGSSTDSFDPFKGNRGNVNAYLKRFDAGGNVQLGYEMANGFNIGLIAELGLVSIFNPKNSSGGLTSIKNTSFDITVGYTLGKR